MEAVKNKKYYEDRAVLYSEKYGIIPHKVEGHKMIYYANHPPYLREKGVTYKVVVNLDLMEEVSRVALKKMNKLGTYNNRK